MLTITQTLHGRQEIVVTDHRQDDEYIKASKQADYRSPPGLPSHHVGELQNGGQAAVEFALFEATKLVAIWGGGGS